MRMTRVALFAGISLLAGLSLKGELLYWMVEDSTAGQYDFAYAGVKDVTSGVSLDYVDEEGVTWTDFWQVPKELFADGGVFGFIGSDAVNHSFQIGLYDAADNPVAVGETKTYGELVEFGAIGKSLIDREEPPAWTGGTFSATPVVPEPTSGVLTLVGLAGLALRRKRA